MHTQEILRAGLLAQLNGSPPCPRYKGTPYGFTCMGRGGVPCPGSRALTYSGPPHMKSPHWVIRQVDLLWRVAQVWPSPTPFHQGNRAYPPPKQCGRGPLALSCPSIKESEFQYYHWSSFPILMRGLPNLGSSPPQWQLPCLPKVPYRPHMGVSDPFLGIQI